MHMQRALGLKLCVQYLCQLKSSHTRHVDIYQQQGGHTDLVNDQKTMCVQSLFEYLDLTCEASFFYSDLMEKIIVLAVINENNSCNVVISVHSLFLD